MIINVIRLILMKIYILCIHGCLYMFYNIKMGGIKDVTITKYQKDL